MEEKALKKYFTSGSLSLSLFGIGCTVIAILWLALRSSLNILTDRIYFLEILALLIGPILIVSSLRTLRKTSKLMSILRRNNAIGYVYNSFSKTNENFSYADNSVIISDYYLFLKESVMVVTYPELTRLYMKYTRNNKNEVTSSQLFCNTTSKEDVVVFSNIKNQDELMHFLGVIKQKNPYITIEF